MSHEGALNTNIRKDMRKKFGGTKRANVCGRYRGLNEVLKIFW